MAQTMLRDYLRQTEDAITSGRVDDALERCQHILAQFPESLVAQRLLGEIYLKQGHLDEAQQTFDWVLTNDPENVIVYCDRALISERMSDYDTALDCYQQAYELSWGNSSIRQEFNQLSAKAGQQGFMFSRAGLARLYMRGDLLSQAIQEWETVLSVSPDRLDVRLGLLETCWRENLYDRVEQLATEILTDVPSCLKALLILAHVVSAQDMQKSQELIQRTQTLDPELVMAQELFGDTIASQPNNPFVKLLKKPPVVLLDAASSPPNLALANETTILQNDAINIPSISSDILANWQGVDDWNGVDTLIQPRQERVVEPEVTIPAGQQQQEEPYVEPFEMSVAWNTPPNEEIPNSSNNVVPWNSAVNEQNTPPVPAWLSMLTQDERPVPDSYDLAAERPSAQQPSLSMQSPSGRDISGPYGPRDELQTTAEASDQENDPFFFGPAWLKSLGAATMDSGYSEELASTSPRDDAVPSSSTGQPSSATNQSDRNFFTAIESLQPSSLSTVVSSQEHTALTTSAHDTVQPGEEPEEVGQESTLSSALAQLGNLSAQSQPPPNSLAHMPVQSALPEQDVQPEQEASIGAPIQANVNSVSIPPAAMVNEVQESPVPPPAHSNELSSISFQPGSAQATSPELSKAAASQYDVLLDELETTMKRPAVRLPPAARAVSRRVAERAVTNKTADDNLSYRQRLVKGYQHQLVGDYDEAMQEYRVIIRGAPELLGEVVSNVRALLKISPKYSAGYRVLGDAYMRQGEYLQAMEAYNKALTMAKRAKGSSVPTE